MDLPALPALLPRVWGGTRPPQPPQRCLRCQQRPRAAGDAGGREGAGLYHCQPGEQGSREGTQGRGERGMGKGWREGRDGERIRMGGTQGRSG